MPIKKNPSKKTALPPAKRVVADPKKSKPKQPEKKKTPLEGLVENEKIEKENPLLQKPKRLTAEGWKRRFGIEKKKTG